MRVTCLLLMLFSVACAPVTHTVKPLPNFVKTGLAVGDTVTVTTHSAEVVEFVIMDIQNGVLIGKALRFDIKGLASIKKHSWSRPESPCGGEKPLGCSVPLLVALASEAHGHYQDKFYDACAQHDYCYRHGATTYGTTRDDCDDAFLFDMQNLCPDPATGKLGRVMQVMDGSLDSRTTCLTVAKDYFSVVRRYGEEKFATSNSRYCEYDGPPVNPSSARKSTTKAKIVK